MKLGLVMIFLVGCATSQDQANAEKFPQCWHNLRVVFEKCIEMNEAGQKVNALQVEELLKKQPIK